MTTETARRSQPTDQAAFLEAYRDHLLGELAEVQRRLSECVGSKASRGEKDLS